MSNINEIPQGSWWYSYINLNTKTLTFLWKFCDLDPKVTPGVGMVLIKTWPISTIMPNMNEIHQRVFKIWGLINFNVKTLTLWLKDERTNKQTYVRTNERTNGKAKTIYPPHTSYVGGIIRYGWNQWMFPEASAWLTYPPNQNTLYLKSNKKGEMFL